MNVSLVIGRKDARAKGLKRYFTGKPCKHGHIADRNVITGKCSDCRFPSAAKWREYNKRWSEKYPGRAQEVKYRNRYGLELSQIPAKPNICDICSQHHKKIVLDHCHSSKKFRGWLCDPCNIVLGNIKDDTDILHKMIDYLKINQTNQKASNATRR
jgi:ribosomal protein L37E